MVADITTYLESDHFSELACEKGNDKLNEEPEPDYDPRDDDLHAEDAYDYLK
jgi:hypothetical protein